MQIFFQTMKNIHIIENIEHHIAVSINILKTVYCLKNMSHLINIYHYLKADLF